MKRRNRDFNPLHPPAAPHRRRSPVNKSDSLSNQVQVDHGSYEDDGPKTSEYAFFKKVKKDAGERFDSHSMQREKTQPNKLNSSECCTVVEGTKIVRNVYKSSDRTNITRNRSKDFSSPLPVGNLSMDSGSVLSIENVGSKDSRSTLPTNNVRHINFDSFQSPVDRAANNSEVNLKNDLSAFESIFSPKDWLEHDSNNKKPRARIANCLREDYSLAKTEDYKPFYDIKSDNFKFQISGSQSDQAELFSKKRQKLRQWAYNSFPEIEELCSKGYGIVSVLLSRLLPRSNEENSCRYAESAPVESNTKSACPKSDIPPEKLYRVPTRNIMEVDYMPSNLEYEYDTSFYWSDISRVPMLSNIYCPSYNSHTILRNNLESPSCELREKNLISSIEGDSTFGFPFVRYGSFLPFSTFEKPDDLHDPNGSLPRREPHFPLVEWDSVNGTSSHWSDRWMETMLSNIYTPTHNKHSTFQNNLVLPICELREKNLMSYIEGDTTFGFPFVRRGSFPPLSSFKEPGDLHDLNRSLPGREPHLPLLEWDTVNMNERSLSATSQNSNWTTISAVRSSRDHQQSLKETFSTLGLCSSPAVGNYPLDFYTLVPPDNISYKKHGLGGSNFEEEEEELVAGLHHHPLTLSHSSKCLNPIADYNHYGIACKGNETRDILPSPGNHLDFMNKAFGEENSTSFGTSLSFAFDVEWKCLQPSNLPRERYSSTFNDLQLSEKGIICSNFLTKEEFGSSSGGSSYRSLMSGKDMVDIHDGGTFYFQISQDKDKAYPLLLDKSSWEDCTEGTYEYDSDSDVKCL